MIMVTMIVDVNIVQYSCTSRAQSEVMFSNRQHTHTQKEISPTEIEKIN